MSGRDLENITIGDRNYSSEESTKDFLISIFPNYQSNVASYQ
ncbi:MAG: hypothetical protein WBM86_27900 [Waterburya sp.]